jgi:hypothetical protein
MGGPSGKQGTCARVLVARFRTVDTFLCHNFYGPDPGPVDVSSGGPQHNGDSYSASVEYIRNNIYVRYFPGPGKYQAPQDSFTTPDTEYVIIASPSWFLIVWIGLKTISIPLC